MTKNTCSAVFALLVCLLPAMSARAAGTVVDSMGFYCTNDPQPGRAWFQSFKNEPYAPTPADAAAVAERACEGLNMGHPVNAVANYRDGTHIAISATNPNLPI